MSWYSVWTFPGFLELLEEGELAGVRGEGEEVVV
jgi:hypothetical protein